jgi:hypothetical protein
MHPQPLICVRDVEASSRWYQRLLGCQSDHGGQEYERLVARGQLVLQLHRYTVVLASPDGSADGSWKPGQP